MEDMRHLIEGYFQQRDNGVTNAITIEEVTSLLARRGVKLHNPIPQDHTKPCYRLNTDGLNGRSWILIEEVNVTDANSRVVGGIDRSVMMVNANTLNQQRPQDQ